MNRRSIKVMALAVCSAVIVAALSACALRPNHPAPPDVSIVIDATFGPPARHGLNAILAAFQARGVHAELAPSLREATGKTVLVAGTVHAAGAARDLLQSEHHALPVGPESLTVLHAHAAQRSTWVLAGADDVGLMYAELDAADRIAATVTPAEPLSDLHEISESPAAPSRGITLFTMNRAYWESRFYDEAYWNRYLDTLARNRFDSIVLIFGYENGGFLAPCYPYFFDTPAFPAIHMVGITPYQQQRNTAALHRLIQMAHDRGLKFTVGIWDHIYRFNVQAGGTPGYPDSIHHPTPGLVWGMTDDNLLPYTKAALSHFLQAFPGIDAIQFRMHDESGLKVSEQDGFWREIFSLMKQQAPAIKLDLRVKGLQDAVIQNSLDTGLHFQLSTKFWMEQMGLPFHPTHVNVKDQTNRRHGYADLLRYPQQYQMNWQLWNGGTARVLLWGDPDFARRFVDSTRLYNSAGFEVDEPLATKMEGQPHDMPPFDLLAPPYRYYDYEFERYWHFFQVFGRIGYNPNAAPEIWDREFQRRFGTAAPAIEHGLHTASGVLPRIVASSYPYSGFPMTAGWAEKQHLGDLPTFAKAEGSDIAQFENADEEAQRLLEHGETARTTPQETSRWFAQTAASINADVADAQRLVGNHRSKEFDSTLVDLKILSNLALYHARRIPAAVDYRLFIRTGDPRALDDAIASEKSAIVAWRDLVAAAGDVYAPDLMMGARSRNLCGHWRDELASLEKGLAALESQRHTAPPTTQPAPAYQPADALALPLVTHTPPTTASPSHPLTIDADITAPAGIKWVRLRYRSVNQYLDYRTLDMLPTDQPHHFRATIPAAQIPPTWDLMYYLEIMDTAGHGSLYPDFTKTTPYLIVHLLR